MVTNIMIKKEIYEIFKKNSVLKDRHSPFKENSKKKKQEVIVSINDKLIKRPLRAPSIKKPRFFKNIRTLKFYSILVSLNLH